MHVEYQLEHMLTSNIFASWSWLYGLLALSLLITPSAAAANCHLHISLMPTQQYLVLLTCSHLIIVLCHSVMCLSKQKGDAGVISISSLKFIYF